MFLVAKVQKICVKQTCNMVDFELNRRLVTAVVSMRHGRDEVTQ